MQITKDMYSHLKEAVAFGKWAKCFFDLVGHDYTTVWWFEWELSSIGS